MQMPPSMTSYETFPCPACGQGIPATMPKGLKFPCPYCQAPIVSPGSSITAAQADANLAWGMQHGAAAAALSDQAYREQHNPGAAHFASVSETLLCIAGDGRLLVVGSQVQADGTWLFKAVDLRTQQTAWELLHGTRWASPPDTAQMAVRADRVYIAHEGTLTAIDATAGRHLWSARLPDVIETDCDLVYHPDEVMLFDLSPADAQGAIVLCTKEGYVAAYGKADGRCLWMQQFDDGTKISPIVGVGVLVRHSMCDTILRAGDGQPIARFSSEGKPAYEDGTVIGRHVVLHVSELGDEGDDEGIAIVDATTGQTVTQRIVQSPQGDPAPVMVAGKVFCSINALPPGQFHVVDPSAPPAEPGFFKRLFGGGKVGGAHQRVAVANMRIEHMRVVGGLVLFLLEPFEGGDGRRIVGIDAATLQPRFDSGPLPEEPSNMVPAHIQANEQMFVYVTAPGNDDEHCELRAISATGQPLWSAPVGGWRHHFLAGPYVVVYGYGGVLRVLDAGSGQPVAAYPFGG